MVTDPVCFTELEEESAEEKTEFRGQTYYFDSERCRKVFEANPGEYAAHIPEKVYGDHGRRRHGPRQQE